MANVIEHDEYNRQLPQINGILWQMLLNNVALRRPWEVLGAGKTLIQWIAVDGYSFVDNPWLPTYNIKLDMDDLATYPFASEIILGTPSYFSEQTSRSNIPLMADLAAKFATLDWPSNVKGFYLPVEIDPTWTTAKELMDPYWDLMPRPLYVSAYYGNGIDGEEAAKWLADLLPPDVHLMFQDGVGAFDFPLELARERLQQLDNHLGAERVHLICEVFKVNPDWAGVDGTYFIPLTEAEYKQRVGYYRDIQEQGRLWVFDGPNYIKNGLIDALVDRQSLAVPSNLRATIDYQDNVRLYSDVEPGEIQHTRKYTIYDVSGNNVIRTYYANSWEGFARYPRADYLEDFGFAPTYIVFDVQAQRNRRYVSDRSPMYVGDIVEDDSVSNSTVASSNWGDLAVTLISEQPYPHLWDYFLDIYHPSNTAQVMRTINLDGATHQNGTLRFDYPVELNVPDYVAAFGYQGTWGYLKWAIRARQKGTTTIDTIGNYENFVVEDNKAFVKKTVIMGINSLIGGYFNDLSDPLNPGGTGNLGRKDVTAAHTFRETMASNLGLKGLEVMPVMTVVGSSPINPMPYQSGFPLDNYWWDSPNKKPGPNLLYADAIVKALGVVPDYFVESGPGETTGISYAPVEQRPAILAAWRQSNIEMLAWMRANWGNPSLEIWFQGATTSWYGYDIPPLEVNAEGAKLLRKQAESMALEGIGFKMGSYVPDANLYTTYRNEMADGVGWIHYTVEGYHAAAREMGEAMALNINRALNPPEWTLMEPATNITPTKLPSGDIYFAWDGREAASGWYYRNLRADNMAVISEGALPSRTYTFTHAAQLAAYGFEVSYVVFEVAEYNPATGLTGAFVQYAGPVITG